MAEQRSAGQRVVLLALGGGLVTASLAMAAKLPAPRHWPAWGVLVFLGLILLVGCSGVVSLGLGSGALSDRRLRAMGDPADAPSVVTFVTVTNGVYVVIVGGGFMLRQALGVMWVEGAFMATGAVYLFAATGRPWWLYGTVRRLRYFGVIKGERLMRTVLLLAGVGFLLGGLLAGG